MENQITKTTQGKFFKVIQGSNYLITDSFQNKYIIEFGQFQNLAKTLFQEGADFVTINNFILNKKFIFRIEPTKELLAGEKKVYGDTDYIQKKWQEWEAIKKSRKML